MQVADIEEDIRTTVRYEQYNGAYYPVALKAYLDNSKLRDSTNPDGSILISSNTVWNYGLDENVTNEGPNLAYCLLRSIARIMGFGSTVKMDNSGSYYFGCKRGYSPFDKLVTDNTGKKLSSVATNGGRPSDSLKTYINTSGKLFYLEFGGNQYMLESPPYSAEMQPFVYLSDTSSLMSAGISEKGYVFQIDELTSSVLNEIGWNTLSKSNVQIVSDDVPDSGLTSAYTTHTFRIDASNSSIQNPVWELELPLVDGTVERQQLSDSGMTCVVPAINNEEKYKVNLDGDIEGRLFLTYSVDGVQYEASPFKIYFELKPIIEYAQIVKIVDNSPYESYDAYYKVKYRGAETIKVSVEEEYSSILKSTYVREPFIASGVADHITSPYYAWIDFTAENSYGKSVYTIELEPYGVVSANSDESKSVKTRSRTSEVSVAILPQEYEVCDVHGFKIGTFENLSDVYNCSYRGLCIVKLVSGREVLRTFKIFTR